MTYSNLERIYKELKDLRSQLKTIVDLEDSKEIQDRSLVTGHLDDLEEVLELLDPVANFDPTPIY